jgi:hypothetical protein
MVLYELGEEPIQALHYHSDRVIQMIGAVASNPMFRNSILPRTPEKSPDRIYCHRPQL